MHVTEVIILKAAKTMLKTLDTHQGMPPQATGKLCFGWSSASAPHTGFFESGFKTAEVGACQETELFAILEARANHLLRYDFAISASALELIPLNGENDP